MRRLLLRLLPVRRGEGLAVAMLSANGFLLLFAYYLIKPIREIFILTEQNAEVRSYTLAAQAVLMMMIIPLYTSVLRRTSPYRNLVPWVTAFLASNLLIFIACGSAHLPIGIPFFIWLGIFSVLIVAQFWAFAADLFSVESGERLFVVIALGASVGAWAGSLASKLLLAQIGPYHLMLLAAALLMATLPLTPIARLAVPVTSSAPAIAERPGTLTGLLGGFRLVLQDPYLRMIALFMILLNCINSTGEYMLARIVKDHADTLAVSGLIAGSGDWIGEFYGDYYAWVNVIGLVVQLLLVAHIFRRIGVGGATLVLPAFAAVGYGLLSFVPVFGLVRLVKIMENSLNYSVQNTVRHALMLPVNEEAKYAGKTTIDTFFWRIGDLLQAAAVWAGHEWLAATPAQFALLNFGLSLVWLAIASMVMDAHRQMTGWSATTGPAPSSAPLLNR